MSWPAGCPCRNNTPTYAPNCRDPAPCAPARRPRARSPEPACSPAPPTPTPAPSPPRTPRPRGALTARSSPRSVMHVSNANARTRRGMESPEGREPGYGRGHLRDAAGSSAVARWSETFGFHQRKPAKRSCLPHYSDFLLSETAALPRLRWHLTWASRLLDTSGPVRCATPPVGSTLHTGGPHGARGWTGAGAGLERGGVGRVWGALGAALAPGTFRPRPVGGPDGGGSWWRARVARAGPDRPGRSGRCVGLISPCAGSGSRSAGPGSP